jgi:hypothetical protein
MLGLPQLIGDDAIRPWIAIGSVHVGGVLFQGDQNLG